MTSSTNHRPLPKRWKFHHPIPNDVDRALSDFKPLLRQLLYNRGFSDGEAAAKFIAGEVAFPTDPFLLKGIPEAIERLHQAVVRGDSIVIYGDYDADGVTSTALLTSFLSQLGIKAQPYIPNRYDEGYGLNKEAIQQLSDEGANLIITVDCGVRAIEEVALANQLGMSVIISDHHTPGKTLPPAFAIIDPKQEGDLYPEKYLAGVGLAYKLVQAYLTNYPQGGLSPDDWVDLVAIGTVADLAPLKGENRMLVKAGLEKIRHTPRQGVYSLAQVAGLNLARFNAGNIGFGLGPRLNAAGRLDSALTALELLTTDDIFQAGALAQKLEDQNRQRQDMTKKIREKAAQQVLDKDPEALLFFAADPEFSEGVVGLAASRLSDAYYRPAIIGHRGETQTVASCRSISEFHITYALDQCSDLLVKHGGHAAAAGLTVRNEDVNELIERLTAIAKEEFGDLDLLPKINIDREIHLDKLHRKYIPDILEAVHMLEPTGFDNPQPLFASRNVQVRHAKGVGREGSHLKLNLQAGSYHFDAIAFRQGYWMEDMPESIDIAYRFEENEYRGRSSLQLNIKDLKVAGSAS